MFLKETTVRSGGRSYVYVQLVQGYRDERGRGRPRGGAKPGGKEKVTGPGGPPPPRAAPRPPPPCPLSASGGGAERAGAHELLGTPAALLNDDRLGRALDALAGRVEAVKGALCLQALERFGGEHARIHWDFTSVSVEGSPDGPQTVRFGHSSDKRAHRRQVKLGQAGP